MFFFLNYNYKNYYNIKHVLKHKLFKNTFYYQNKNKNKNVCHDFFPFFLKKKNEEESCVRQTHVSHTV
jgi:hypothetical protein